MLISVIISTYNRPDALRLVLEAFESQSDRNFEVIIADDGSEDDTKNVVDAFSKKSSYRIIHAFQEDKGFRLSRVRNLAALKAHGDYLIFLDGDCVPCVNFIKNHRILAQKGALVAGNRILLSEKFTNEVLSVNARIFEYGFLKWLVLYIKGGVNRLHPLIELPNINLGRNLGSKWKYARGCNFALFKEDYFAVNGCDSAFEGWGYEDSDLAVRLIHKGLYIRSGHYATGVLHLYHHENDRSLKADNLKRLHERISSDIVKAISGIKELLTEPL